jgi:hypothetical protein
MVYNRRCQNWTTIEITPSMRDGPIAHPFICDEVARGGGLCLSKTFCFINSEIDFVVSLLVIMVTLIMTNTVNITVTNYYHLNYFYHRAIDSSHAGMKTPATCLSHRSSQQQCAEVSPDASLV